jgi:hypothetical protein
MEMTPTRGCSRRGCRSRRRRSPARSGAAYTRAAGALRLAPFSFMRRIAMGLEMTQQNNRAALVRCCTSTRPGRPPAGSRAIAPRPPSPARCAPGHGRRSHNFHTALFVLYGESLTDDTEAHGNDSTALGYAGLRAGDLEGAQAVERRAVVRVEEDSGLAAGRRAIQAPLRVLRTENHE